VYFFLLLTHNVILFCSHVVQLAVNGWEGGVVTLGIVEED
jgi:hypothetical protein